MQNEIEHTSVGNSKVSANRRQKICNAKSGDFGSPCSYRMDNYAMLSSDVLTFRCQLPKGHEGHHQHKRVTRSQLMPQMIYDEEYSWPQRKRKTGTEAKIEARVE